MALDGTISERRRQTRSSIYHYLYDTQDFCTRQKLAQELGLSLPTVYQNLAELMDAGLIQSSGEQQSTGGRKAQGLAIVPDARIAVGASVTDNRLRLSAVDLRLNELAYERIFIDPVAHFSDLGALIARELEQFLDNYQIDRSRLLGVGIALPAVLSPDASRIVFAPTLQVRDASLEGLIRSIPYPTYVANDSSSGGRAEWFVRRSRRNMAYLSLENGVGGAVLLDAVPYHGDNLRSGEFGHMCVEPGGLRCKCGRQGCLEAYCSARRLQDAFGVTLEAFFEGLKKHVPEYETLWHDVLRHLAIGVNNIRMALDCDVVLGGFLTEYIEPYLPLLKEYVAALNTFEPSAEYLQLSTLRKHTVPLGVALHFVDRFLEEI